MKPIWGRDMLLELKDIRVHYNKVEALKGISLGLGDGMIITLLGANGAGKTTTLNVISGLKSPTSGEIWYRGERMKYVPAHKRVKLGIAQVPEGRRVFPYMTVLENLKMGAYLQKDRREVNRSLEEIFSRFPRLKERQKQVSGSLSGGEQQLLAVARALMSKPKVLLMDEPTLGLAPIMAQEIAEMIQVINQMGISIILVEQNACMALTIAHTGYVLEIGNIVLMGEAKNLIENEHVRKSYLGE